MTGIVRDAKRARISLVPHKGDVSMKNVLNAVIALAVICCAAMLIAHRRVIAAYIKGEPMPEVPEWHRKHCMHCCGQ